MTQFNGYIWNSYLPQQYLWDSTCGYHAIKNTINLTSILNKLYIDKPNYDYSFNDLLFFYNSNSNNDKKLLELSRNYYIYLNNGVKYASIDNLSLVKDTVNKDNKLYFWDKYEDKQKIKLLINNNVEGIFGFIVYHNDLLVNHWYGIIVDINNNNKNIHLLDSYGIIHQQKKQFNEIMNELNIVIIWKNKYSQSMSYLYKLYQACLFVFVYFIIIYAIIYLIDSYRKSKINN